MNSQGSHGALRATLGRNVRIARLRRKWSQERLAEATGLTQVYISRLESGKVAASLDTIEKLASGLDCEPHSLLIGAQASGGIRAEPST